MTKHCKFIVMASAAIVFAASSMPLQAEGLGGLGKAVGGTLGGLGNAVGNTGGAVGNAVNGVTGKVANTTTKLGTLKARGALSADARSDILNGVRAKARVLSPEELARLCLAAGGGDGGCGSGNKPRILGLIDARLAVLSDKRLIGLCASAGAGCGGLVVHREAWIHSDGGRNGCRKCSCRTCAEQRHGGQQFAKRCEPDGVRHVRQGRRDLQEALHQCFAKPAEV